MKAILIFSFLFAAFSASAMANERVCQLQYKQCKLAYKANSSLFEFGHRSRRKDICQASRHACLATSYAAEGNLKSAVKACKETKKSCAHTVDANASAFEFGYRSRAKKLCRVAEQTCLIAVEMAALVQAQQNNEQVDEEEILADIADELDAE